MNRILAKLLIPLPLYSYYRHIYAIAARAKKMKIAQRNCKIIKTIRINKRKHLNISMAVQKFTPIYIHVPVLEHFKGHWGEITVDAYINNRKNWVFRDIIPRSGRMERTVLCFCFVVLYHILLFMGIFRLFLIGIRRPIFFQYYLVYATVSSQRTTQSNWMRVKTTIITTMEGLSY